MTTSPSESLLVRQILAGQPEAWRELIGRYEGRLLEYVAHRAPSRAAAEDG